MGSAPHVLIVDDDRDHGACTAFGSLDAAVRVLRAADYLSKPFEPKEIVDRIRHALEQRARRLERPRLREEVDEVLRNRRS